MRLRALLFAGTALGCVAVASWHAADFAAAYIEEREKAYLRDILTAAGELWLEIEADGLLVTLNGIAPDEATRFGAVQMVQSVTNAARIIDKTSVFSDDPVDPPRFVLELLRNESEISLVGLVPLHDPSGSETIETILEALPKGESILKISQTIETSDQVSSENWLGALTFGLRVVSILSAAKVSVEPGFVSVTALVESADTKERIERKLTKERPPELQLHLEISVPRPIISPFTFSYHQDGSEVNVSSCSAENEHTLNSLDEALRQVTPEFAAAEVCDLGLGAPNEDWSKALLVGIAAVQSLGKGSFEVVDSEVVLTAHEDTKIEKFKAVASSLSAELPENYKIRSEVFEPVQMDASKKSERKTTSIVATLNENGELLLEGAFRDDTSRQAIMSYATATFAQHTITDETSLDSSLPDGWAVRVLAGLDALSLLSAGSATLSADSFLVEGQGTERNLRERIRDLIGDKIDGASISVSFDAEAASDEQMFEDELSAERPEVCIADIGAILKDQSIAFRPGSSHINPSSRGVIAAIADVLRNCPGSQVEVAGHTDSQGKEATNTLLSKARAEAVTEALQDWDLPLIIFRARGYGEDIPIADNGTAEGRRQNRRIEITLFSGAPVQEQAKRTSSNVNCENQVSLILSGKSIEFGVGDSTITPASQPLISELASALSSCGGTEFEIRGHTDNTGRSDVNRRISLERAEAVLSALREAGLAETVSLTARGYGAEMPIADNSTPDGRAQNRRIEMHASSGPDAESMSQQANTPETGATDTSNGYETDGQE